MNEAPTAVDLSRDTARVLDESRAAAACRALIEAYGKNPSHVDWDDVSLALEHSLAAFRLPSDYCDRLFEASEDAEDAR